jgi:hypothetical protein
MDRVLVALGHRRRVEDDAGVVAGGAVAGLVQVALAGHGGHPGSRADAHDVDDHARNADLVAVADGLLHQAEARPGGSGERLGAGKAPAQDGVGAGDLVLFLEEAELGVLRGVVTEAWARISDEGLMGYPAKKLAPALMAPSRTASFPWTSRLVIGLPVDQASLSRSTAGALSVSVMPRCGSVPATAGPRATSGTCAGAAARAEAASWACSVAGRLAVLVALGQNLDGEVRAVALAQAAADAVGGLDDGVVGQDEAVLGTDLDADIAALAPLIDPTDVDEVDDGGRAVYSSFGGLDGSDGRISRVSTAVRGSAGPVSLRNWAARRRCGADPARGMRRD